MLKKNCRIDDSYLRAIKTAVQVLQVDTQKKHAGQGHLQDLQIPLERKCLKLVKSNLLKTLNSSREKSDLVLPIPHSLGCLTRDISLNKTMEQKDKGDIMQTY